MAITLDDDQAAALLEALGLPADTTDVQLVVDTATDLAAQAAGINAEKPSTIAAAATEAGLEVMDKDTADALRHDASEGRKMIAAAAQQRVEASVDDAVRRGKITPARRKHWITLIGADPGMADVLASIRTRRPRRCPKPDTAATGIPASSTSSRSQPSGSTRPAAFQVRRDGRRSVTHTGAAGRCAATPHPPGKILEGRG